MIELVIVSRLLEYPDAALAQHQNSLMHSRHLKTRIKRMPRSWAFSSAICWRAICSTRRRTTASCLTVVVRRLCCCLSTFTVNPRPRSGDGGPDGPVRAARPAARQPRAAGPPAAVRVSGAAAERERRWVVCRISPRFLRCSARVCSSVSRYAVLFDLLVKLANASVTVKKWRKIADEARDDTRKRWMRSGKKSR